MRIIRNLFGHRSLLPSAILAQTARLQQQIEGTWQVTVTFCGKRPLKGVHER